MLQNKMISEFLKDLPCHDSENFSLFNTENGIRTSLKRPSVYLPTDDYPAEQLIVTEKRSILLRYLHQQWEKKNPIRKRDGYHATGPDSEANADGSTSRKRPRWESRGDHASPSVRLAHLHQQPSASTSASTATAAAANAPAANAASASGSSGTAAAAAAAAAQQPSSASQNNN